MIMLNLHLQVTVAEDSADFQLLLSSHDENWENVSTIGSLWLDDPELSHKLRLAIQAYRMGMKFGRQSVDPEVQAVVGEIK